MPRRCDLWRIGIVDAPIDRIARAGSLEPFTIDWLDPPGNWRFAADPFGLVRDGTMRIFAELYDYRERHGRIGVVEVAGKDRTDPRVVIDEPWHLSYPAIVEDEGETWLLPEASKGASLSLYRALDFPDRWERSASIMLDVVPIDATPFRHDGRWWLAYSSGATRTSAMSTLHLAFADRLSGPWTPHPGNPVLVDRSGARPGGTPFELDGQLILPVQDCVATYGAAIRLLHVDELNCDRFRAAPGARLVAPTSAAPYTKGMHTLSACGPVTLIDVKRIDRSGAGLILDLKRWWRARRGLPAAAR